MTDYIQKLIIEGNTPFQTKIIFLTAIFVYIILYFLDIEKTPVNIMILAIFIYYFLNIYLQKEYTNTNDFNRITKYKLQKLRKLTKEYISEKLDKIKFILRADRETAYKNGLSKLDYFYMDVNFIHFMDNISYFYEQNKEDYIALLKCIGNILKLRWESEQINDPNFLKSGQIHIRTVYANFEETVRLKELALNHFQALILTIPKSNSSYKHHQDLINRLHLLLLRAVDIQRAYYNNISSKNLTTATQFLPNKNVFTKENSERLSSFNIY